VLTAPGRRPAGSGVEGAAPMRAAVLSEFGCPPEVVELPRPVPRGAEVLVRVAAAGVCRLDVEAADGLLDGVHLPAVLGHEVAGWVAALGPAAAAASLEPGIPVVVHGAWGCGACARCRAGDEQLCDWRRWCGFGAPGGFAEFLLVPHARHLVALDGLDPTAAAYLGDTGLTPYRAVRRGVDVLLPGTAAVVVGAGALGQVAVQLVKALTPVHVVAVDVDGRREGAARESGADAFVAGLDAAAVREALRHRPAAAVFDMAGTEAARRLAARVVAPGGRVVAVGLGPGGVAWPVARVAPEASLTTTFWGSRAELVEVVALAAAGRIFMRTDPFPLDRVAEAMRCVRDGCVDGRAVLVP